MDSHLRRYEAHPHLVMAIIGDRTYETGYEFMVDLCSRVRLPFQLTTDGLVIYSSTIEDVFQPGMIDHRVLKRIYPSKGSRSVGRTSYIERQNLTLRMTNRRYARDTNAHSKTSPTMGTPWPPTSWSTTFAAPTNR